MGEMGKAVEGGERQGRKGRYTYLGERRRAVSRAGRRRRDGTGSANCSDETASASARRGRERTPVRERRGAAQLREEGGDGRQRTVRRAPLVGRDGTRR